MKNVTPFAVLLMMINESHHLCPLYNKPHFGRNLPLEFEEALEIHSVQILLKTSGFGELLFDEVANQVLTLITFLLGKEVNLKRLLPFYPVNYQQKQLFHYNPLRLF